MNVQEIWQQKRQSISDYYSQNSKKVNYILIGFLAVIGLGIYWTSFYKPAQEKAAAEKLAKLHYYFKNDSMNVVLKGFKPFKVVSAPSIADDYSSTRAGKEAALMAGIAYIKTAKFKEALEYLDKTSAKDDLLSASVIALKGSCKSEMGNLGDAASLFEQAAAVSENEFAAMYLKKAGIHHELNKDYSAALKCYETIQKKYSTTPEGSDIEKYVFKMKAQLGEFNP
jgi:tetratricopeptide (TPR) repeat protein